METIPGSPLYWRPRNQLGIIKNKLYIWSFYRDTKYWTKTKYPTFLSSLNVHIFSMFRCLNVWMSEFMFMKCMEARQSRIIALTMLLSYLPSYSQHVASFFLTKMSPWMSPLCSFTRLLNLFQDSFKRISIEQIRTHFKCLGIS